MPAIINVMRRHPELIPEIDAEEHRINAEQQAQRELSERPQAICGQQISDQQWNAASKEYARRHREVMDFVAHLRSQGPRVAAQENEQIHTLATQLHSAMKQQSERSDEDLRKFHHQEIVDTVPIDHSNQPARR